MFVVCCWGGRVVPLRAWSKSSLTLVSLLCVSFTISYLFHLGESVGWLLRGGPAKLSQLKLWHYFEQGRLGKVPSAMVSLLAFLYMCLSAVLLGWKGCPFKSMKQELFDIVFTSSVVFTISAYCNLCEGVCSCLLLMGWNGCRLVCLFAVAGGRAVPSGGVRQKLNRFWLSVIRSYHARVGGLAQALFRRLGFSAPPLPSLLSLLLLLLGICLSICWWGGSVCFSANLGPSSFSKSRSSPLHVVFSILFHYFLCSLPLPLFLQGWQGCLLPVVLYLSIFLERLFQRELEARAHWHCVHFFVVFLFLCLFLLLIAFGWKAWLLKGGPAKLSQVKLWHYFEQGRLGKIPSAMVLLLAFLYMCLSFVAGVEGLSH